MDLQNGVAKSWSRFYEGEGTEEIPVYDTRASNDTRGYARQEVPSLWKAASHCGVPIGVAFDAGLYIHECLEWEDILGYGIALL